MWEWGSKANDKVPSAVKLKELLSKTLDDRKRMSNVILTSYPNSVPIIITRSNGHQELPDIDKIKFILTKDNSFSAVIQVVRKYVEFNKNLAIFLFVAGQHIPSSTSTIAQIYEQYKNEDGFLYITYNGENTFG